VKWQSLLSLAAKVNNTFNIKLKSKDKLEIGSKFSLKKRLNEPIEKK
jgi:hypothetical protein